jgi:hypothetical protein
MYVIGEVAKSSMPGDHRASTQRVADFVKAAPVRFILDPHGIVAKADAQ